MGSHEYDSSRNSQPDASASLLHRGNFIQRHPVASAVGGVVLAAVAYSGYQLSTWIQDMKPSLGGTDKDSEISVETLTIEPINFDCRSFTVFDTSGSSVRTTLHAAGRDISFIGYGADMPEGRVIMQACSPNTEISTELKDDTKIVNIPLSGMTFNSSFHEPDTRIVNDNTAVTQILGGAIDVGGGVIKAGCNVISLGEVQETCEKLKVISRWNEEVKADLQRSFRVRVLEEVQNQCAPQEWSSQVAAITDAYKEQAVEQGGDPDDVEVRFVDDNGNETDRVPDFSNNTVETLITKGVISATTPGAPELVFENLHCTKLTGGYKPKYPQ